MPRLPLSAKEAIWDHLGYVPSPKTRKMHDSNAQHLIVIGGEGGGKSYGAAMELLPHLFLPQLQIGKYTRKRLYWIVAAEFELARPEFGYVLEALRAIEEELGQTIITKVSNPDEGRQVLETIFGCRVETRSAAIPKKCMAGRGPQGILYCEAGMLTSDLWDRGLSRMARSEEGVEGWSYATGLIQQSLPWYLERFESGLNKDNPWGMESFQIPTWENLALFPMGVGDPKILKLKATLNETDFEERIAAKIAPPQDIVFPEFDPKKHIKRINFNPSKLVWLAIDPGYSPGVYAVLALQIDDDQERVYVIDEIYKRKWTVHRVIDEAKRRPWFKNVGGAIIDPFGGTQRQGMPSHRDYWMQLAKIPVWPGTRGSILEGIERYRYFLSRGPEQEPFIFWNLNCVGGIGEHRRYSRTPTQEGRTLRTNPIDRDNHALKAVTYFIYTMFGRVSKKRQQRARPMRMVS